MAESMENGDVIARFEQMLRQNGNGFSQTRDQVAALTNQVALITQNVNNLVDRFTSQNATLVNSINDIKSEFAARKQSPIALVTVLAAVIVPAIGGLYFLISAQTTAATAPILTQLSVMQANVATFQSDMHKMEDATRRSEIADENSRTNRVALVEEVRRMHEELSKEVGARQAFMSDTAARWMEQETQFKGLSNLWNQGRADQLRFNGIIWQKDFGVPYPSEAYYPNMYNEHPSPIIPGSDK